ncbi:MAG: type II secretion system F family protein [Aureliella sp.]
MLNFSYLARDRSGRLTRGAMTAESPTSLRASLQTLGLHLVSLEARPDRSLRWNVLLERLNPLQWLPPRSRDVETALRQMALMLRSGLDLLGALAAAADQSSSPALARILVRVGQSIKGGGALTTALARYAAFPPIAVQLIGVGEQTGSLDSVLEQAAEQMAARRASIAEVRAALAYPVLVATAAISIAVYLIFAVIPELQKFLSAMGRKLPRMTQSLVDLSLWCQLHGSSLVIFAVMSAMGLIVLTQWPPARMVMDRWLLRVPIIGGILRLAATATLAGSLAVMIRSGIKLVEALAIAERLQTNRFLAAQVVAAVEAVKRGKDFSQSLAARHGYAPMLPRMVAVAERTGELGAVLDDVAKFCQAELRAKIKRLSMLVEPAIIVLAGGIIGYVYLAFFMALMSAGGSVK